MLYSQPEGKVFGTVDKHMRLPSQAHTPSEGISYAVRGCLIRRLWSEAPEGKKTRQNMAFFKKQQLKSNGKWYPRSVTVGKPVTTDEVAARLSQISTVSRADTYAVLKDLGLVLGDYMAQGRTVKLEGVGTFYFTANATKQGVDSADEVSAKQITGVRVRFIPETGRSVNNQVVTRSLVPGNIFWEEWGGSTSSSGGNNDDEGPASGDDGSFG